MFTQFWAAVVQLLEWRRHQGNRMAHGHGTREITNEMGTGKLVYAASRCRRCTLRDRLRHLPQPTLLEVSHHISARGALDAAVDVMPALAWRRLARWSGLVGPVLVEERLPMAKDAVLGRVKPSCRHT
jgi:hypothetical protein